MLESHVTTPDYRILFGAWSKDGFGTCKPPSRWVRPRRGMQDQILIFYQPLVVCILK